MQLNESYNRYRGEIEFIIKDKNGRVVNTIRHHNLIKAGAKEIIAHCVAPSNVWDPDYTQTIDGITQQGGWVTRNANISEFTPKYILFGASFDTNYAPLGVEDPRYYQLDASTGIYAPNSPSISFNNGGDLINPVPISEDYRPLKRIERVYFEPSYQPAGVPTTDGSVRAINNVLVLETTMRINEYNGMGIGGSDSFTIAEVALAGGREITTVSSTDCTPSKLFMEGVDGSNSTPIPCVLASTGTDGTSGSAVLTITSTADDIDRINVGDTIYITVPQAGVVDPYRTGGQVQPYYLVLQKDGATITLDRIPKAITGAPPENVNLTGTVGIYRNTLKLFSQRILTAPFTKSADFEIVCRWLIYFN